LEAELNLDPDSNPDPESDPELITDPDPNLQIISDPDAQHCFKAVFTRKNIDEVPKPEDRHIRAS
jgi:hypothetical protein